MTDSDYNIIKPIEGLHNIAGSAPTQRREERKRRQKPLTKDKQEGEQEKTAKVSQQNKNSKFTDDENCGHSIDYCA